MSAEEHAIVLSGGGANGAYGIGVMEALFSGRCRHSPDPDPSVFTGTSVGCYNAAVMASRTDEGGLAAVRHLRRLWLERIAEHNGRPNGVFRVRGSPRVLRDAGGSSGSRREELLDFPRDARDLAMSLFRRGLDLTFSNDAPVRRLLRAFDVGDLISTTPLERLIADTVDVQRLLEDGKLLRIVACDWDTGDPVVFFNKLREAPGETEEKAERRGSYELRQLTHDNAAQAIRASTAIPAFFPRVEIGDEYFVDGGVVMNTPLNPAIEAGANVLHVIHLEPELAVLPFGRSPSAFESVERILAATPVRLIESDLRYARLRNELIRTVRRLERVLGDGQRPVPGAQVGAAWTAREDLEALRQLVKDRAGESEIVIHRYYPSRQIGGAIGLLDFEQGRLIELIDLGFRDAVEHDCRRNHCVV